MSRNTRWLPALVLLTLSVACAPGPASPPELTARRIESSGQGFLEQKAQILYAEAQDRITDPLIEALRADEPQLRLAAVRALGRIEPDDPRIDSLLEDPNPGVRAAAWFASLLGNRPRQLDKFEMALDDEAPLVRESIARALGLRPDDDDAGAVLRLLADEDPNVQEAAAFAASRQPTPSRVIPTLTEWTRKGSTQTQYAAVSALASLARPAVTKGLDRLSRNEIRRTLVSLAAHPSANVRVQIARGLDLPESEAARAVLQRLTLDTDLRVRFAALTSYRFPGVDFLTGPLATALLSQDIRMNRVGLQALEGVNTAAATSRLIEAIVDLRNPWLKEGVIRAIRRMEPSLAARLANGLSKEPLARHRAAALAALEFGPTAETKAFADQSWADSDPRVRAALVPIRLRNGLTNSEAELQAALDDPGVSVERALTKTAGRIFLRQTTTSEDRLVAARILRTMWDRENERNARELRLDILRTIERGTKDQQSELGDLLKRASEDPDARIRHAAERSGAPGDSTAEDPAFDLATCRKIAAWAMVPHALEATVERPGFPTGRFRIQLDVENAPRASWWFAEQAAQGKWDNRLIDDLVPADFLRIGDADPGEDRRYPPAPLSEIGIARYRAGTVALTGMGPDRPDARLFIALTARPGDFGRYTPLGTVASNNFVGVVWNLLPGDRMVRLRPVEEESN